MTSEAARVGKSALLGAGRVAVALVLVLIAAAALASGAMADGDPASDILLSQQLFLPTDSGGSGHQQAELAAVIRAANRDGFPIRVAVIPSAYDLGSVGVLWRRPRVYARFLAIELSDVYDHALLVVMPSGVGVNWPGHPTAAAYRALASVPILSGGGGLVAGAQTDVEKLAASGGVEVRPPAGTDRNAGGSSPRGGGNALEIALAALVVFIVAAVILFAPLRTRLHLPKAPIRPREQRPGAPPRLRWTVPGLAVLCCVAAGAPLLIFTLLHRAGPSSVASVPAESAPFTWAAGRQPAPNFQLTDQSGRPVSLAAYRGRPVIVTFMDPLCRNLCPLAAQVLNQADRELPVAQRPAIIAVSIDIYADSRADLHEDFARWHLVPQWLWAVGKPKQLAAVWSAYKIGVAVLTKRIAGTTIHEITHDEVAYVVDPNGYERALFVWPYYPQDVIRTVQQITRA